MDSQKRPRLVTIEDVVDALAGQCDGARSRDGRGFNRADAQEGGRLAAMKARGLPWSVEDARRAMEIAARYSKQAGVILGGGREAKAAGIEGALRSGRVTLADEPVAHAPPYNYACLSPGGKRAYFWKMTWIEDLPALVGSLASCSRERHGVRRIRFDREDSAEITVNGARKRTGRLAVDYNGTSRAKVLDACRRHGFIVEPAMEKPLDAEIDGLRRRERAAWLHRGVRDGRKGVWAVFDLASRHDPFSADVKRLFRGRFECDPKDDWNWFVEWDRSTIAAVLAIAGRHGFACSDEILSAKE